VHKSYEGACVERDKIMSDERNQKTFHRCNVWSPGNLMD
jgi:hypothetical protein